MFDLVAGAFLSETTRSELESSRVNKINVFVFSSPWRFSGPVCVGGAKAPTKNDAAKILGFDGLMVSLTPSWVPEATVGRFYIGENETAGSRIAPFHRRTLFNTKYSLA